MDQDALSCVSSFDTIVTAAVDSIKFDFLRATPEYRISKEYNGYSL